MFGLISLFFWPTWDFSKCWRSSSNISSGPTAAEASCPREVFLRTLVVETVGHGSKLWEYQVGNYGGGQQQWGYIGNDMNGRFTIYKNRDFMNSLSLCGQTIWGWFCIIPVIETMDQIINPNWGWSSITITDGLLIMNELGMMMRFGCVSLLGDGLEQSTFFGYSKMGMKRDIAAIACKSILPNAYSQWEYAPEQPEWAGLATNGDVPH